MILSFTIFSIVSAISFSLSAKLIG